MIAKGVGIVLPVVCVRVLCMYVYVCTKHIEDYYILLISCILQFYDPIPI